MSKLLETESKLYATRKHAAERAVVRWEWATGPYYALTPYSPSAAVRRAGAS